MGCPQGPLEFDQDAGRADHIFRHELEPWTKIIKRTHGDKQSHRAALQVTAMLAGAIHPRSLAETPAACAAVARQLVRWTIYLADENERSGKDERTDG